MTIMTFGSDAAAKLAALERSQAVIEFKMDGTINTANENFLKLMGYSLGEIVGKHHSIFVDVNVRETPEYKAFWDNLNRCEFQQAQFSRIGKAGNEVWIEATYNPVLNSRGRPYKVVKFATDVTQ